MVTPSQDAENLRKAMKGFGTDEDTIIKIIANRTNKHRLKIIEEYKSKFDRDLIDDLKSELSGKFEDASVALFKEPIEFDVQQLKQSMKGAGTDEDTLIEIVCSRPQEILKTIKEQYKKEYNTELEDDVRDDTSGNFQRYLLTILKCERSVNEKPTHADCSKRAQELIDEGEKNWGNENSLFEKLLLTSSTQEIMLVAKHYHKKTKKTLIQAVKDNFEGDVQNLFISIIYATLSPSEFYATKIHKAMDGVGTNENLLTRVLITRDEIDLPQIKQFYKKLYNKDMIDDIKSECSGDYQKLLLEIAGH
jgi:hypothetical protein